MEAERWDFTITTAHNLSAPAMRSASPRKILELVLGVLHHHCLWLKDHIRSNFSLLRLKTLFSSGKKGAALEGASTGVIINQNHTLLIESEWPARQPSWNDQKM